MYPDGRLRHAQLALSNIRPVMQVQSSARRHVCRTGRSFWKLKITSCKGVCTCWRTSSRCACFQPHTLVVKHDRAKDTQACVSAHVVRCKVYTGAKHMLKGSVMHGCASGPIASSFLRGGGASRSQTTSGVSVQCSRRGQPRVPHACHIRPAAPEARLPDVPCRPQLSTQASGTQCHTTAFASRQAAPSHQVFKCTPIIAPL